MNFPFTNTLEILEKGVIGLGFLLAFLAWWLLREELKRPPGNPGRTALVGGFMIFSIILCGIGLVAPIVSELSFNQRKIAYSFNETCSRIRTSNWLDDRAEARKYLSQMCQTTDTPKKEIAKNS